MRVASKSKCHILMLLVDQNEATKAAFIMLISAHPYILGARDLETLVFVFGLCRWSALVSEFWAFIAELKIKFEGTVFTWVLFQVK
jgi:hypothetical protein